MKASEAMVKVLCAMEGVHEVGFNNHGPQVEEFQSADDLPGGGYAWCESLEQWGWDLLGIKPPSGSASVGIVQNACEKAKWGKKGPGDGYSAAWCLDSDSWPDHRIRIKKVVSIKNGVCTLKTIEGNTSAGTGSISDGGGVYQRTRIINVSQLRFFEEPMEVDDKKVQAALKEIQRLRDQGKIVTVGRVKRAILALPTKKPPEESLYWLWLRWQLGEGEFKKFGPMNTAKKPKVLPRRAPKAWWERRAEFMARRKKRSRRGG